MPAYGKRKGKGKGKGKSKGKGKGRVPGGLQKWMHEVIAQGIRQGLAKLTKQFNKSRKGRGKGKAKSEEDRKAFLQAQQKQNDAYKQNSNRACSHDDEWFTGRLKRRTSAYRWITLDNLELLPEDLRQATITRMESGLTVSRKQKKRSADNTASGENATTAAPLPLLISFA